uniref:P53 and DNA damage-regulated protein 1 n=1 Tax=Alexandrium monilatum TaxID=311494 RepID=A0A6T0QWM1_9DINO|mmetsp:Transcript_30294/g.89785  ORF Transcript_30294/g.89785 Transcript_30294/m.89785 type:complete len:182 (+) Transcript_30294:67-612(+)
MLDRTRLLRIEALADEVLRTQEDLVMLDREQNGRREALGSFRRGEAKGGTHWLATEGQFIRLPAGTAREYLHSRHEEIKTEISEGRSRLKSQTQALLHEHPSATDIHPGVWELLLQEQRQQAPSRGGTAEDEAQERGAKSGGASAPSRRRPRPESQSKKDRLDYSRFDHIADSDSDGPPGG